ncbi:MAG: acetylesterase [Clostridia bacterium]|nr:acetylesterase [Clostridia bacterium]
MAILHVSYLSKALLRTVPVDVVLPVDKLEGADYLPVRPYKTLYLLHGYIGSEGDWLYGTRIARWAADRNLAVVMPSGENAFYVNGRIPNSAYGDFVGSELVEMTRRMFPLSAKREDTYIAGLSMGGFGAIRNGIVYSDTFSRIGGFSSALHLFEEAPETISGEDKLFGDMNQARQSDRNPCFAWKECLARHEKSGTPLPEFYLSCGRDDSLLESNRSFKDFLAENGAKLTYIEDYGAHEWDFWDRHILRFLDWLPLDEASEGVSSGHVVTE